MRQSLKTLAIFIACLTTAALAIIPLAFAQQVTVINQGSSTATGSGAGGTPSLTINIPDGDNRAIFILPSFEREHCSQADETAGQCGVNSPALSDNFASPNYGSNTLSITISGPGGSIGKTNPLVLPDGDLRFYKTASNYSGSTGNQGVYLSLENYHYALYESEIETLLGGAASGNVTITLSGANAPTSAGDDASLIAVVFENVNESSTGIVRNGTAGATTSPQPGNVTLSDTSLDAGQDVSDTKDGFLVYGATYGGGPNAMGFATMSGYTPLAGLSTTNSGGNMPDNLQSHNESDGLSMSVQFRNGPVTGYTLQGSGSSFFDHYGALSASFKIDYARADLQLTKVVTSTNTPTVGGTVTFRITVTNDGPDNTDLVRALDQLPAGYSYESHVASAGTYDDATGVWDIGYMADQQSVTLDITARILPSGSYQNRAEVTNSSVFDPDSSPNDGGGDDSASVTVSPAPAPTPTPIVQIGSASQCALVSPTNLITASDAGTFGTGTDMGQSSNRLGTATSDFTFQTYGASTPQDGNFSHTTLPNVSTFGRFFDDITGSTTGTLDDYFMVVNAGGPTDLNIWSGGIFTVPGGTEAIRTTLDVANMRDLDREPGAVPALPDVGFYVNRIGVDDDGDTLIDEADDYLFIGSSGPIPEQADPIWYRYETDVPMEGATSAELVLRNLDGTVAGNDLAVDTIKAQTCIYPADYADTPADGSTAPDGTPGATTYGDAIHLIDSAIRIGAAVDSDLGSSISSADASGDGADDDGVAGFPALTTADSSYAVNATVTNTTGNAATLHAWIDFDRDGSFETTEHTSTPVANGANGSSVSLNWASLPTVLSGNTFARLRLTTDALTSADAAVSASDGEVEDYQIPITQAGPPTEVSAAECALSPATQFWQRRVEWSSDAGPAGFDPKNIDGTVFSRADPFTFGPGISAANVGSITEITGIDQANYLDAYNDGDYFEYTVETQGGLSDTYALSGFSENGGRIGDSYSMDLLISDDGFSTAVRLVSGVQVDDTIDPGSGTTFNWINQVSQVYLTAGTEYRIRAVFYDATPVGGKVTMDDFSISIDQCADRGDAPYATGDANAGAHYLPENRTYYIGSVAPDAEFFVNADDNAAGDVTTNEESGITLPDLRQGENASIDVPVTGSGGRLNVWIDWNGDEVFDATEKVATDAQLAGAAASGTISLSIPVPATATLGTTYARFRWSPNSVVNATDNVAEGEIEDYAATVATSGTPFSCTSDFYISASNPAYTLRIDPGTVPPTQSTLTSNMAFPRVNGTAYNTDDDFIYTIERGSPWNLVRLSSDGSTTTLGPITGLDGEVIAGDFNAATGEYVVNILGFGYTQVYSIDIATRVATNTGAVIGDVADIAYNPVDGLFYGIVTGGNVISIDPNNGYAVAAAGTNPAGGGVTGAVFFDSSGTLFALNNGNQNLYSINLATDTSAVVATGVGANNDNDGSACPNAAPAYGGTIAGTVYVDADGSDSFNAETAIPNVTVRLYDENGTPGNTADDTLLATDTTAGDGSYGFGSVAAGGGLSYRVEVDTTDPDIPAGTAIGTPNPVGSIALAPGGTATADFGFDMYDYGDAPAGYGEPRHALVSAHRLGASVSADTGGYDDANAAADAGDDGVTLPASFEPGSTVVLPITVTGAGYLNAWIDWNGNGIFDDIEQIAADVQDTTGSGTISLSVHVPADSIVGQTYARFRWTSDYDLGFDGPASNGEVEDYRITTADSTALLTGSLFLDNGSGGGTAHDGLIGGTEARAPIGSITLFDGTATQIATATVNPDGTWSAVLPAGYAGTVQLVASAQPGYRFISEDTSSLSSVTNPSTTDGTFVFSVTAGTSYGGVNIGLIAEPTLTQDQSAVIQPGGIASLPHVFTATTAGTLGIALVDQVSNPADGFNSTVFEDVDCDGIADQVAPASMNVAAGQQICLIVRTQAGSGIGPGASYTYGIETTIAYTGTGIVATLRNDDRIDGGSGDELVLRKLVRNLNTPGSQEQTSNSGDIGDVLRYRIILTNPSGGAVTNVEIFDTTPAYTRLNAPIATSSVVATGVTCTLLTPSGGSNGFGYSGPIEWNCPGSFLPGAEGSLIFDVQISQQAQL